jgi:Thioesterase superfamily
VDVADALLAPSGPDPHAGAHPRLVAGIDDVQQRGVGPVEADERPGKGTVERVLLVRVADPRPGGDLAIRADLDEVVGRELLAGLGVVLSGRADHVAVLGPDAEEPAVAQAGHEAADDRADGARVRVLEDVGGFEDVRLRHGQMRTRSRGASQTAVDSRVMTLQPDPREVYAFMDPAEDLARARKHELVREVKRLIDLTAHIDVERADRDDLAQLADDAAALADRLEPLPSLLEVGGMAAQQGPQGALLERSGISGRANPLAPPMQWHPDGDILRGWATYSPAYEGPIGNVHGGFVAAAFDDLMGMAQMASGSAGYTGTLTVKMLRPTPLGKRIDYEAGVERVDGRKIYVWAKSRDVDTLLAEAEIVFIAPKAGMPR